jgi:hypothetical protein
MGFHRPNLLEDGYEIRTIQESLGHKDVATMMIYTYVLNRGSRQLFIAELLRATVVMLGQLPHGPRVSLLGSCRESPQLHILKHPFA